LLLLQKTMLVAEGVGRRLNPDVNMWELAHPLIEEWMLEHRSPDARLRHGAAAIAKFAERLPNLVMKAETAIERLADGGFEIHPGTVRRFAEARERARASLWPLWIGVGLVLGSIFFG
jgi:ubiquinone biosynthesis protein